jgi:hypothetical protein
MRYLPIFALAILANLPLRADDGAASIAAGGIIVMTRESRIVMAKEVLNISGKRVDVGYEFRNDSDTDITTGVAFPIPAYSFCCDERNPTNEGFDDFKVWVGGQPQQFMTETRAIVNGRDITDKLQSMSIDIATFGHYSEKTERSKDLDRLNSQQTKQLVAAKIIDNEGNFVMPLWKVQKKYYWQQTFPAHAVVHIRHTYTPWVGSSNSIESDWLRTGKHADEAGELPTVCPSLNLLRRLRSGPMTSIYYVDFILTTANTWKQPIEDFTLNVQRDPSADFVSFCWAGPVVRQSDHGFTAHRTNFIPKRELRIGFLTRYK